MRSFIPVLVLVATIAPTSVHAETVPEQPAHRDVFSVDRVEPSAPTRQAVQVETYGTLGRGPDTVRVEVLVQPDAESQALEAIDGVGGRVVGSSPGVLLADIRRADVATLASTSAAVSEIREPMIISVDPGPTEAFATAIGPGGLSSAVGANAWHAQGHTGASARVGIIDFFDDGFWAAAQSAGTVPSPAGVFCRAVGSNCNLWDADEQHGVAVAEGLHQIAPGAALYLATVVTVTDLAAAIDWFDANGVTIISRSLGSRLDSAGNGTGPLNAVANDAVSRGMTWFNAAGNHSAGSGLGRYWRGVWVDDDADNWLDFGPGGQETLGLLCTSAIQGFRWSDWGGNATDYDAYLFDESDNLLASSEGLQNVGAPPLEFVEPHFIDCNAHPTIYLSVRLFDTGNGTAGDVLEFMVNNGGLELSQNANSASGPIIDSANPGVMTVGAIDPGDGTTIASYSSQGPTNDGRKKPDIAAPSCYPSVAYAPDCFNGTSGATPVAAGVAALLTGSGVATSPSAITSYIRTQAIDRGAAGIDNVYGSGQLRLGSPPVPLGIESDGLGLVDPTQGLWHLYDGSGNQTKQFYFGNPGDIPIVGDWNCDGVETAGMYRQSDGYVYLRNSNTQGNADIRFFFGDPGDEPVAGDFNGDGCGTVSVYRPSNQTFYIINKLGKNDGGLGAATTSYVFGNPGDKPFVGDFDGDGLETVGLHRESTGLVYFRNTHTQGNADNQFIFGNPGDRLIAGDWNDNGVLSPALFRPSNRVAYFRFTNSQGNANAQFHPFGAIGTWLPVAGDLG